MRAGSQSEGFAWMRFSDFADFAVGFAKANELNSNPDRHDCPSALARLATC